MKPDPVVEIITGSYTLVGAIESKLKDGYTLTSNTPYEEKYYENGLLIQSEVAFLLVFEHANYDPAGTLLDKINDRNVVVKQRDVIINDLKTVLKEVHISNEKWEREHSTQTFMIKSLTEQLERAKKHQGKIDTKQRDLTRIKKAIGELAFDKIIDTN